MRSVLPPPKVNPPRQAEYQRLGYPSEYAWAQDQGMLEIPSKRGTIEADPFLFDTQKMPFGNASNEEDAYQLRQNKQGQKSQQSQHQNQRVLSDSEFEEAVRQEMLSIERDLANFAGSAAPAHTDYSANSNANSKYNEMHLSEKSTGMNQVSFRDDVDGGPEGYSPRMIPNPTSIPQSNPNQRPQAGILKSEAHPSNVRQSSINEDHASLMLGNMYKNPDELKRDRIRRQQEYYKQLQTDPIKGDNPHSVNAAPVYRQRPVLDGNEGSENRYFDGASVGSNPNMLGRDITSHKELARQQQEDYRRRLDQDQQVHGSNFHNQSYRDDNEKLGSARGDQSSSVSNGVGRGAIMSYRSVEEEKKERQRQQREEYRRQLDAQRLEKEAFKKKQSLVEQAPIFNGDYPTKTQNDPRQLQVNTRTDDGAYDNGGNYNEDNRYDRDAGYVRVAGDQGQYLNHNPGYQVPIKQSSPSVKSEARSRKVQEVYGKNEVISPVDHYNDQARFDAMSLEEAKKEQSRLKHLEYSRLLDEQRKQKELIKKQEKDLDCLPIYNGKFLVRDKNKNSLDPAAATDGSNTDRRYNQPDNSYYEGGDRDQYQSNHRGNGNDEQNSMQNNFPLNTNEAANNANLSPKRLSRSRKVQEVYGKAEFINNTNDAMLDPLALEEAKKEQQRKAHEEYRKQLDIQRMENEAAKMKVKMEKERLDKEDRERELQAFKPKRVSRKNDQFLESSELELIKKQAENVDESYIAPNNFNTGNNGKGQTKNVESNYISPNKARERKMQEIYGKADFASHEHASESYGSPRRNHSQYNNEVDSAPANPMARLEHLERMKELAAKAASQQVAERESIGMVGHKVKAAPPVNRNPIDNYENKSRKGQNQQHTYNQQGDGYDMEPERVSVDDRYRDQEMSNHRGRRERQEIEDRFNDIENAKLSDSFRRETDYGRLKHSSNNDSYDNFSSSQKLMDILRNDSFNQSSTVNINNRPSSADETDLLLLQWQMKQQKLGLHVESNLYGREISGINDFPVIESHESFGGNLSGRRARDERFKVDTLNPVYEEDLSMVSETRLIPADPWAPEGLLSLLGAARQPPSKKQTDQGQAFHSQGHGLDKSLVSESYMVYMNQGDKTPSKATPLVGNSMTATSNLSQSQTGNGSSPLSAVIRDANAFLKNENSIRSNPSSRPNTGNSQMNSRNVNNISQSSFNNLDSKSGLPSSSSKLRGSSALELSGSNLDGSFPFADQSDRRLQDAGLAIVNSSKVSYSNVDLGGDSFTSTNLNNNSLDYSQGNSHDESLYNTLKQSSKLSNKPVVPIEVDSNLDDESDNDGIKIIPKSSPKTSTKSSPIIITPKSANLNADVNTDIYVENNSARSDFSKDSGRIASAHESPRLDASESPRDDYYDETFASGNFDVEANNADNEYNDNENGDFGDLIISGKSYESSPKSGQSPSNNGKNKWDTSASGQQKVLSELNKLKSGADLASSYDEDEDFEN